ncbi:MAG: RluA family pseudouridine synthase [Lachnospiraceae bacterium]|nr:RluA family pseudouridine synthase [Lachnospiraceae bacterium]
MGSVTRYGVDTGIIYEDRDIIVIHKSAGIPVQSGRIGKADCCSLLKKYIYEKTGKSDPFLGVVHRLDEPVEGVMVFALNKKAASVLSGQIREGLFNKEYKAAVYGDIPLIPGRRTELTDYILQKREGNVSLIADADTPGAKKSGLIYEAFSDRVTSDGEKITLLNIELHTGRHHQIRVQLSHAGFPICGDRKYGKEHDGINTLCLCADRLTFLHPVTGEKMSFNTEPEFLTEIPASRRCK